MTDRFFLSGFDTRVLMLWMQEVRQTLIALNDLTPETSAEVLNQERLERVLNNSNRTLQAFTESTKSKEITDKKTRNRILLNLAISAAIVVEEKVFLSAQNKQIEQEHINNATLTENLSDSVALSEAALAMHPDRNQQQGYSASYRPRDAQPGEIATASPKFPTHGQPYNSHMQEITEDMISRVDFDVFTGAADPAKPSLTFFKSWAKVKQDGTLEHDSSKTFTPDRPYSAYINEIIKNSDSNIPIGTYRFFIEKLHGRYSNGVPYRKNKVKSTKDQNQIPLELTNRMVFAAYINNYNSQTSPEKTDYNFLGRAEGVPVYQKTKRSFTLEFSLLADFSAEMMVAISEVYRQTKNIPADNIDQQIEQLVKTFPDWGSGFFPIPQLLDNNPLTGQIGSHIPGMYSDTPESLWYKMTFLEQCCYPYYRSDGKMKEQPMIRIRVADFYDVIGMITNLSWDLNELEGIQIDLNPSSIGNVPLAVKCTMNVDIYHNDEPTSNYFGFFHRREFDDGSIDPVTGKGSLGLAKQQLDYARENIKKNSPTEIFNRQKNDTLLSTPMIFENGDLTTVSSDIRTISSSLENLSSAGINLKSATLNEQAKRSMQAYMRIQKIISAIRIQQGLPITPPNVKSGDTNFGGFVPSLKGQNLPNIADEFRQVVNPKLADIKDQYSTMVGQAQVEIEKTMDALKEKNTELRNTTTDFLNDVQAQAQEKIASVKQSVQTPKTLGEILSGINIPSKPSDK